MLRNVRDFNFKQQENLTTKKSKFLYLICIGNVGYEGSGDETRNEITQ